MDNDKIFCKACQTAWISYIILHPTLNNTQISQTSHHFLNTNCSCLQVLSSPAIVQGLLCTKAISLYKFYERYDAVGL